MDELNLYLQSLVQEACSHPPTSPQRSKAINRLLRVLQNSKFTRNKGDGIYEEALYKTMFNLSKTVCEKYDPNRGSFLTWFNICLRNQYRDELRAVTRHRSRRKFVRQNNDAEFDPLDTVAAPIDATFLGETWELFVQWIKDDPDNLLKTCHLRNNPKINCQLLAYLKVLSGKEEKKIADEFGLSRGTISAHWERKCKSLMRQWLEKNQRFFGEDNYER